MSDFIPGLPDYDPNRPPNPSDPRDRSHIPAMLLNSLLRYAGAQRVATGAFLRACLENNLADACNRADDTSVRALPAIVTFIYNELPSPCWGSKAKVVRWLRRQEYQPVPDQEGEA